MSRFLQHFFPPSAVPSRGAFAFKDPPLDRPRTRLVVIRHILVRHRNDFAPESWSFALRNIRLE